MLPQVVMKERQSIKARWSSCQYYTVKGEAPTWLKYLRDKEPDRDLPTLRELSGRPGLSQIEKAVDAVLQSDEKLARQVKIHMCHRHSGKKLREIGKRFGIGESGVTQASRRIGRKAEEDKRLRALVKTIERRITLSNV